MANIKQQKKRILTAQRQRSENLRYRSTIKTLFNRLQLAVDTGEKEVAEKTHHELVRLLDRAIARGVLHRNTAARKKARASRMLLQEPKKDATTIRKAKKKVTPRKKAAPKAAKTDDAKAKAAKADDKKAEKADEPKVEDAPVEETTAAADEAPSEVAADEPAAPEAEAAVDAPAEEPEAAAADEDAEAADEAKD